MSKEKTEQKENTKAPEEKAENLEETPPETAEEVQQEETKESPENALEKEVAAWKDKYMRLAAEYDNYRKRTSNEKLSIYDDATARAVTELLPVADSM
ncbi:MAG TPA: nucleotide exchange factor GrpE, partial [Ruminococcus sp.]|nr:nucleotide exchange factor GrpE [Ruminococcus sp.]